MQTCCLNWPIDDIWVLTGKWWSRVVWLKKKHVANSCQHMRFSIMSLNAGALLEASLRIQNKYLTKLKVAGNQVAIKNKFNKQPQKLLT